MKTKLLWKFTFSFSILSYSKWLLAAACCGGGFALPSVIVGDEKAQVTSSIAQTEVIRHVDQQGFWTKQERTQRLVTYRVEAAHIFKDRWQVGAGLPYGVRHFLAQEYAGAGDLSLNIGYEYLPDWNYNPLRPKGLGFLQLTIPSSPTRVESQVGGLDMFGTGFYSLAAGSVLTKVWGNWDAFFSIDLRYSFAKKVSNSSFVGQIFPGWSSQQSLGAGFSFDDLRLGGSLSNLYQDSLEINGSFQETTSIERNTTLNFSISYLVNDEWATTASVSDQSLLGSPLNTSLGRTVLVQLQKRWSR